MWEELTIAFNIIGGLALFMYGVTLLRETLGKISGKRVVRILEKVSNNRIKGMGAGTAVPACVSVPACRFAVNETTEKSVI